MNETNEMKTENDNEMKTKLKMEPCWRDESTVTELLKMRLKYMTETENKTRTLYRECLQKAASKLDSESMTSLYSENDKRAKELWIQDCIKTKKKVASLQVNTRNCNKHSACKKINAVHKMHDNKKSDNKSKGPNPKPPQDPPLPPLLLPLPTLPNKKPTQKKIHKNPRHGSVTQEDLTIYKMKKTSL